MFTPSTWRTAAAAASLILMTATGWAQTPDPAATPRIDQREARQQARIAQGAASGALTPRETRRLEREQAAIQRAEAAAKSDGVVTAQERRKLRHAQNRASHDIARQKHDAQTVPPKP